MHIFLIYNVWNIFLQTRVQYYTSFTCYTFQTGSANRDAHVINLHVRLIYKTCKSPIFYTRIFQLKSTFFLLRRYYCVSSSRFERLTSLARNFRGDQLLCEDKEKEPSVFGGKKSIPDSPFSSFRIGREVVGSLQRLKLKSRLGCTAEWTGSYLNFGSTFLIIINPFRAIEAECNYNFCATSSKFQLSRIYV